MTAEVLTGELTFKSLKPLRLNSCTKQQIRAYFENSYDINDSLFSSLKDDSVFYKCPDCLRLPLIFYYGHTAVVYVNKLILAGLIQDRINLELETILETGVDEMSWDDTENYRMGGCFKWPTLQEVVDYRKEVREVILKLIRDTPLQLPITMESPWWALIMGMDHERIHIETSSVLIRQLPVDMVTKPDGWVYGPPRHGGGVVENILLQVPKTDVTLGKPRDFPSYGWDNEYGEVSCTVPTFEASQYLVTNREFLEFVEAGCYTKRDLWTEEGWAWTGRRQATHPNFWVCTKGCVGRCGADLKNYSHCQAEPDDSMDNLTSGSGQNGTASDKDNKDEGTTHYRYRAMFDVIPLPMDWPVEVNYHEAKAFCAWKGPDFRLPTEAENHAMRGPKLSLPPIVGLDSDIIFKDNTDANLNLQYGSPTPVNLYPSTERGFHDVFGNVWGWTEDHFNGLDGYESHWLYDDISTPLYDGFHNIMMGGSWVSTGEAASRFIRFAFRRHFFQHTGFRLARTKVEAEKKTIPAMFINTDIYIVGQGVQENPVQFDENVLEVTKLPTRNTQYFCESITSLHGALENEFGYQDALPSVMSRLCGKMAEKYKCDTDSALWIGSGTGKGPFLLAKVFDQILAVDFVGRYIETALELQAGKEVPYTGSNGTTAVAKMEDDVKNSNVVFKQLTWLPNEVGSHNMSIVTLLERALNPKAWLVRLWEVTKVSGIAVVASTDGRWCEERLQPILGSRMECITAMDIPYEGMNKSENVTVTVWQRHSTTS